MKPPPDKRDLMLKDTYHIINRYINMGRSEDRHALWLQGQKIRSHLLVTADISIESPKQDRPTTGSKTGGKSST